MEQAHLSSSEPVCLCPLQVLVCKEGITVTSHCLQGSSEMNELSWLQLYFAYLTYKTAGWRTVIIMLSPQYTEVFARYSVFSQGNKQSHWQDFQKKSLFISYTTLASLHPPLCNGTVSAAVGTGGRMFPLVPLHSCCLRIIHATLSAERFPRCDLSSFLLRSEFCSFSSILNQFNTSVQTSHY